MIIENKTFDEERALYAMKDIEARNCSFDGPNDGESAFKEGGNIRALDCFFNLRYPFWHVKKLFLSGAKMTDKCRAALWYCDDVEISGCDMHGIKALRECSNVKIYNCDTVSPEFGWFCNNINMRNCDNEGEYFMLRSKGITLENCTLLGKYSFQYIEDSSFEDCNFNTKDAFWHAKNVTVKNSIIKGEYLAWYCENVTFENCLIFGTQPFCYCKNLKLINCEMVDCDLSFERSEVYATLTEPVLSIKNPYKGKISVPKVYDIIIDDENANCEIEII